MKKNNYTLSDLEQVIGSETATKIYDTLYGQLDGNDELMNIYEDILRTIVVDILEK